MYRRVNVMLPTYKRVHNEKLQRFIQSAIETCHDKKNICFTFCVNSGDSETRTYLSEWLGNICGVPCDTVTVDNSPPNLARYFNTMYLRTKFRDPETLVSMFGDDMVFKTRNWDRDILTKMNLIKGMGFVYCDDDYLHHENLCVNLVTSRLFVEATGKPFMCMQYPVDWIDTIWMEVGKRTGTGHYLGHVKIKHEHASCVGADETFKRLRENYSKPDIPNFIEYVEEIVCNLQKTIVTS